MFGGGGDEKRKYKEKKYIDPDNTPFLSGLSQADQDRELFKRYRFTADVIKNN